MKRSRQLDAFQGDRRGWPFAFLVLAFFFFPVWSAAFAGSVSSEIEPPAGMRHMAITKPKAAEKPVPVLENKKAEEKKEGEQKKRDMSPLSLDKALVKPEDLAEWPSLSEVTIAGTPEDADRIIRLIESDPGAVPPQGLFMAAGALAGQKRIEEAALYFFAGQLRMMFDVSRWPPRASEKELAAALQENRKAEDQRSPSASSLPPIRNPHAFLSDLAREIGAPIIQWAVAHPDKFDAVLKNVKKWDESAPYAYLPGYEVGPPMPFEHWKKSLPQIRALYFERMKVVSDGLRKVKTP